MLHSRRRMFFCWYRLKMRSRKAMPRAERAQYRLPAFWTLHRLPFTMLHFRIWSYIEQIARWPYLSDRERAMKCCLNDDNFLLFLCNFFCFSTSSCRCTSLAAFIDLVVPGSVQKYCSWRFLRFFSLFWWLYWTIVVFVRRLILGH